MEFLQAWKKSLDILKPRNLKVFLVTVGQVSWHCYKTVFYYFWWVIILFIIYHFGWYRELLGNKTAKEFIARVLIELITVFDSGIFFLIVSYAWVVTTNRMLPRVVDYFIRGLYFYIPYVFLKESALFVEEHIVSLGVALSVYSFILLVLFALFLFDTKDGIWVPLLSGVRAVKMFFYNVPFFLLVGATGIGLEVGGLSLIRFIWPSWQHELVQRELFYVFLPLLVSVFSVYYARQTDTFHERYFASNPE